MKFLHFLCFIFLSQVFFGQSSNWKYFNGLTVQLENTTLRNPWSGSMNNAQVNAIDLNGDGLEDLWIFDRVAQRSIVFRQENKQWIYDFALEKKLPIISDWLLVADYDGDGKKDVFTSTNAGIKVLRNITQDGILAFSTVANPLVEEGFSGTINLYVATTDIPAIKDIDGDGDLDILAFEAAGHVIEWHQNISMERTKSKGLLFQKNVGCWKNLVYQDCSTVNSNQGCNIPSGLSTPLKNNPQKTLHSGNSLALFLNNGTMEVWMGHVGCSNVNILKNEGKIISQTLGIPFPATYFVDVDLDGQLDALVSPNSSDNNTYQVDFSQSLFRLKEVNGTYEIKQKDFLQDSSLDVGENASPVFFDVDSDGDLDLLMGNAAGQIYYFERISSGYRLKSNDFGGINQFKPGNELKLSLGDWNKDGEKELYALSQTLFGPVLYGYQPTEGAWQKINQKELLPYDQLLWMDLDFDGKMECLILHRWGKVDIVETLRDGNSMQFITKKEDWGNLTTYKFTLQSFVVLDELGTGHAVLLGVDKEGNVKKALLDNGQLKFVSVDEGLDNRFGKNVQVQSVDINGDGKPDLAFGTAGGGVMLFQNMNQSAVFEKENQLVQIWPNPTDSEFFVRSKEKGTLRIIDLQGKIIFNANDFPKNQSIKIDIHNQFKGIYIVQFISEYGKIFTEKIILH